jgi:hypothetical protein
MMAGLAPAIVVVPWVAPARLRTAEPALLYKRPRTNSRTRVATIEIAIDPRQPRRFEKKKNIALPAW